MHTIEAIRIALQSLWVNKLRSVLTLLGVVIGVAAVIAVVTFVSGINDYVAQKIFNLGADVFIIFKVSPAVTNVDHYLEGEKRKDLTMEDYKAVLEACRHCVMLGASTFNPAGHVKYGEQSVSDSWIRGLTPTMAPILDLDLASGRMLNDNDENNRSNVAVIGTDIADNLFPGTDPLNKEKNNCAELAILGAVPPPGSLCAQNYAGTIPAVAHLHGGEGRRGAGPRPGSRRTGPGRLGPGLGRPGAGLGRPGAGGWPDRAPGVRAAPAAGSERRVGRGVRSRPAAAPDPDGGGNR